MENYTSATNAKKYKTQWEKQKTTRCIASSIASKDKDTKETHLNSCEKIKTIKIERKAYYNDYKQALNKSWRSTRKDISEDKVEIDVPSKSKSYTIQDKKIVLKDETQAEAKEQNAKVKARQLQISNVEI